MSSVPPAPQQATISDTTDNGRLLSLTSSSLGNNVLLVNSFTASEQLSRLFTFDLDLMSDLPNASKVSAGALLGTTVSLRLALANGTSRFFHGIVKRFIEGEQDQRFRFYQAQVVPWFWLLTLGSDCRIFQEQTVPEIIKQIFDELGFHEGKDKDYRNDLKKTYTRWDYCVQYRETNYNFVSRMMEQEGIYYFFEHTENSHTLILADTLESSTPNKLQPEANFIPSIGSGDQREGVSFWQKSQTLTPGKYVLRDHHFEMPSKTLEVRENTKFPVDGNQRFEVFDFPGEYAQKFYDSDRLLPGKSPSLEDEGSRVAKLRIEEEDTGHEIFIGSSDCRSFEIGRRFRLSGHPTLSASYVITSIQHTVTQTPAHISNQRADLPYSNTISCMVFGRTFRPSRITLRPVMQGPQTAVVVGPDAPPGQETEEIHTDKHARVKVQFHWDRKGKKNDHSSAFVRVAYPWAGQGWGAIFIPRVGQEVVVDFLEGDPDQPIVIGSLYNADHIPPFELPANKTQSGIKTRSSKKGGRANFNEIRFEDKKDNEDLLIHAERTMHNSVEASQFITVGGDRHVTTGGVDKNGDKHGDLKELVFKNHNLHVKTDERIKIEGESHLHVQKNADATYDADLVQSIGGKWVILADTIQLQGTKKIVLIAGSSSIVIDASGVTVLGSPLINLNSPGAPPVPEIIPLVVDPDDP